MELRDIEIFLTLAEELHFGRTAERSEPHSQRPADPDRAGRDQLRAEMIPILVSGEAVSPVHAHATRHFIRTGPDIAYVPIHDAAPGRWAPVWRSTTETQLIRAFAGVIRDLGPLAL